MRLDALVLRIFVRTFGCVQSSYSSCRIPFSFLGRLPQLQAMYQPNQQRRIRWEAQPHLERTPPVFDSEKASDYRRRVCRSWTDRVRRCQQTIRDRQLDPRHGNNREEIHPGDARLGVALLDYDKGRLARHLPCERVNGRCFARKGGLASRGSLPQQR